jgi:pimeloyl-ACP methyl ester carboxylesterase
VSTVISRDRTAIAYSRTGEGPAMIMVDGTLAYRAINTKAPLVAALLAPQFAVYTYDRRGRGESGDMSAYSVEREVDDLEAIIARHGDGQAFVFGSGSGALLALDAVANGLQAKKLAIQHPPLSVDGSPQLPDGYLRRMADLVSADRRCEALELYFTEALKMPSAAVAAMQISSLWTQLEAVAPTLLYDATLLHHSLNGRLWPSERWSAVTVPTLVIDDEASPPMIHAGTAALVRLLPDARRRTLASRPFDAGAGVLASALAEFFSDEIIRP